MKIRICAHEGCGLEIPAHRNKNAKYCSDECYYENKKSATLEAARRKLIEKILLINDLIVSDLFKIYGSTLLISPDLLTKNFNWKIISGETLINGVKVNKLINYGYTIYTNLKIQLWKL